MPEESERMGILQMIEDGEISAAEGLERLNALTAAEPAPAVPEGERAGLPADFERWRRWWVWPLTGGLVVLTGGALLMFLAFSAAGLGLWFACASLPFAFGVAAVALAAAGRSARWIHIRVDTGQDEWPRRIILSFPLPIRLTAWGLRTFGPALERRVPQLGEHGVDELILALAESTSPDAPLYVDVQEGATGEHVQVYIG
jgi:hypothetical protein